MSGGSFAIFLNNGRDDNCVLLTDGAWTDANYCFRREHGYVWHKPRLFKTQRAAQTYKIKNVGAAPRYIVGPYTGPTEPWDSA